MRINKFCFKNKESIKLSIYLIIIVILTIPLLNIFIRAWEMDNGFMKLFANAIWDLNPSGVTILITFIAGLYLGSFSLMLIDEYKRFQSIIFFIALIYITYYIYIGNIFPNINWINNVSILGIGALIGILIGGGKDLLNDKKELKFQKASNNLTFISIFFILFAVVGNYFPFLLNNDISEINIKNFIEDLVIAIPFIFFLGAFLTYTAKSPKIFILGPEKSGKSLFLAGCYLQALKINKSVPTHANTDLLKLIESLHRELGDEDTWFERTNVPTDYYFMFKTGSFFPKKVFLKTLDYPGIYLENINEYLEEEGNTDPEDEFERQLAQIVQEILNSEKLLFIIDAQKFPHFDQMGIRYFINILRILQEKGNVIDSYIIMTKCDIFLEEYKDKSGKKEDFIIDYNNFKNFMKQKFEKNVILSSLINESFGASFYPIFYYTQKNIHTNEYLPLRDEYRNVFTFGIDELMFDLVQ